MKRWIIFLCLSFLSCGPNNPEPLTTSELALVDTLYNRVIDSIRIHYDSLCEENYDSMFSMMSDSIVTVRIEEIMNLKNQ